MMINIGRLKAKIVEAQTTQEAVAKAIGMDRSTFSRKIKSDGKAFTIGEVHKIIDTLPLTKEDAIDIFFNTK